MKKRTGQAMVWILSIFVALPILLFMGYVILSPAPGRVPVIPDQAPVATNQASTEEPKAPQIRLDAFECTSLSYSSTPNIATYVGEIRNGSGRDYEFLSLNLNIYTDGGELFDVVNLVFHNIANGESRSFKDLGFKKPPSSIRYNVTFQFGAP